jgi:predicted transcriptional regulator
MLISKGILKKEIEVLRNKRLAYKYSLRSIRNIVDELKIRLLKIINELEEFVD